MFPKRTHTLARLIRSAFNHSAMKFKNTSTFLLLIILACTVSSLAFADAVVGVKKGDWVEYNATFTGKPPAEHDVVWAKMEVLGVEGQRVNATFESRLANGTMLNVTEDLDFATGKFIDMFIIPAGQNAGDSFYAHNVGVITIDSVNVRPVAGAARTIVHAVAEDTQWFWDRATGVVVEAYTTNSVYTLDTVAVATGLWSQQILGFDEPFFYALLIVAAIVIVMALVLGVRRKRKTRQRLSQ
jgi:hypothetical protein